MRVYFNNAVANFSPIFKSNNNKKQEVVAVLGSSKATDSIMDYMSMCANAVKSIVLSGNSIIHGAGKYGIMGAASKSAAKYSEIDENGKPKQSLAIITDPLWGNEDLDNCVIKDTATSEAARIEKFSQRADKVVIFPGSSGTIQEAASFISSNNYAPFDERKKVILVGKKYYEGLVSQYENMYKNGLLNDKPENLFTVVDSEDEILKELN